MDRRNFFKKLGFGAAAGAAVVVAGIDTTEYVDPEDCIHALTVQRKNENGCDYCLVCRQTVKPVPVSVCNSSTSKEGTMFFIDGHKRMLVS